MPKLSTTATYKLCWISHGEEMKLTCYRPGPIITQMEKLTARGIASLAYVDDAPAIYSAGKLLPSDKAA